MRKRKAQGLTLAMVAIIALILAMQKPIRPPKTRAQHIHTVNEAPRSISFLITNAAKTNSDAFPVP